MRPKSRSASDSPRLSNVLACALLLALQACAVVQYRPEIVIGTGTPGSVYFALGNSICRLFNLDLPARGLRCGSSGLRVPLRFRSTSAAPIGRIAPRAHQQRHVVVLLGVGDAEIDAHAIQEVGLGQRGAARLGDGARVLA